MKLKQKLAILLAGTMIMATPSVAFATDIEAPAQDGVIDGVGGGDAPTNKDIFKATIPTALDLGFKIDPQGLLNLASGSAISSASADAIAGGIYFTNSSEIVVSNKGAMPITFTATVKATNGATGSAAAAPAGVAMVANTTDVASGTALNMYLAMTPAKTITASGSAMTMTPGTSVFASDSTGIQKAFAIEESDYEFVGQADGTVKYQPTAAATVDSVGFKLSGSVNKNADWKDFTGSTPDKGLGIQVIYAIDKLDGAYADAAFDTAVSEAKGLLANVPTGSQSSVTELSYSKAAPSALVYDVPLEGSATKVTRVSVIRGGTSTPIEPGETVAWTYNPTSEKLTFVSASPALTNWVTGTYTITLFYDNTQTSSTTLTLHLNP